MSENCPSNGAPPGASEFSLRVKELEQEKARLQTRLSELERANQALLAEVRELRSSESTLRASESSLATIFARAEVGISEISVNGRFLRVNDTLCRILGRTREELLGLGVVEVTHPDDVARSFTVLTHLLETGIPASLDKRYVRPDGELVWANSAVSRIEKEHGEVSVLAVTVDLTERRRNEERLLANESWFRLLADAVPQFIWTNDATGKANYFNKRWLEFCGMSLEESKAGGWVGTLHPGDVAQVQALWEEAQAMGIGFDCEYRVRRYDGEYRWVIGRTIPLRDDNGRVSGWFGSSTDIDDLKKAESALALERERLRLIVDSCSEHAIFSMDLNRAVTHWGAGAEKVLGFTAHEMIGKPVDRLYSLEDREAGLPEREFDTALRAGRAGDSRWQMRRDGSRFWANRLILPMRPSGSDPVIGFVQILTDETKSWLMRKAERKAVEELEKAHAEAEAAVKAKDHFLAILSHELRTPLTPVSMILTEVMADATLPESLRQDLQVALQNVQVECHLIDDLLDLSRIVHGKFEIAQRRCDLHESIRSAVEMVRADIVQKEQALTLDLCGEPVFVSGDAVRLQQVVWNLLKNASKFTPQRGAIRLRTFIAGDEVVTEVRDNGIGIRAELIERIFAAFDQGSQEITRRYGGLGLGLAISSATLSGHGARLLAESPGPGQGATFSFRLALIP